MYSNITIVTMIECVDKYTLLYKLSGNVYIASNISLTVLGV